MEDSKKLAAEVCENAPKLADEICRILNSYLDSSSSSSMATAYAACLIAAGIVAAPIPEPALNALTHWATNRSIVILEEADALLSPEASA